MVQPIPWYISILVSIPEAFLLILLGFALFNYPMRTRDALVISVISASFSYGIHRLPIIFGMHTIIMVVICIFLSVYIGKKTWLKATLALIGGVTALILLEALLTPIFFTLTHINYQSVESLPWLHIVMFFPEAIIMVLLYLIIRRQGFYIMDFNKRSDKLEEV